MEEIVYHTNYKLEDNYWWFVARNRIVYDTFNKICELKKGDEVLDVGCGTGGFTKILSNRYEAIGLDSSELALEYCRKRGLENLYSLPLEDFPKEEWDVKAITMLDVIEHVEDDRKIVKEAFDILPKGGYLMATVPAYMWLWSGHDVMHMHYRRYKKSGIEKVLRDAGFNIEYSTYFNFFLLPAAALKRLAGKISNEKNDNRPPVDEVSPFIDKLFRNIFLLENKLLPGIRFPFGVSLMVIGKKTSLVDDK